MQLKKEFYSYQEESEKKVRINELFHPHIVYIDLEQHVGILLICPFYDSLQTLLYAASLGTELSSKDVGQFYIRTARLNLS